MYSKVTIKSLILKGLHEHIHGIFCTKYNLTCFLMALGIEVTLGFLYPIKSFATMFFSKSPPFLLLFSIKIKKNQCFYSEKKSRERTNLLDNHILILGMAKSVEK